MIVAVACNDNSVHRTNSGAIRVRASRKELSQFQPDPALVALRRRQPGDRRATPGLEGFDGVAVFERDVDVVDAAHQAILAQRADVETVSVPVRRDYRLVRQIDGDLGAGLFAQLPPEIMDHRFRQRDRDDAVLDAVPLEDLAEAHADQRLQPKIHHRESRALARRAATEVLIGDENFRVAIGRLVGREIGAGLALVVETQVVEERLAVIVAGTAMPAHVAARQDHAGIDLGDLQGRGDGGEYGERLHRRPQRVSWRTSASRPNTAAAATIAGLMMW